VEYERHMIATATIGLLLKVLKRKLYKKRIGR